MTDVVSSSTTPSPTTEDPLHAGLRAIAELRARPSDEDGEHIQPSLSATQRAAALLWSVHRDLPNALPPTSITDDGEGGIFLYWTSPKRLVQLMVPGQQDGLIRLYHDHGSKYGIEPAAPDAALMTWLTWLHSDSGTV